MTDTQRDTFEHGIGVLASDRGPVDSIQEDSPIAVNGVAIPENTVLRGGQDVAYFFEPAMAERAASVLQQQIDTDGETVHLVKNFHEIEGQAPADDIIGEVTAAGYSAGVGVVFEGETTDVETAQKINNGYLDVSPTVARSLGDLDDQMQARRVTDVAGFRDIAVVGRGQPGADVSVGPNPAVEALSRDALGRAEFDVPLDTLAEEDTMSLDDAKQTIAEEYEVDVDAVDAHLDSLGEDDPDETDETDDRTVVLIED